VKLSVNLVSGNRYYRAGEEIPNEVVPVHAAKWAVDPDADPIPKPTIAPHLTRPRAPKGTKKASKG
jgi:hypothetical protein